MALAGACLWPRQPAHARARGGQLITLARPTRPRWRWPPGVSQLAPHCESATWAGAVSWQRRQR
eukprot:6731784-Pyramimonas_sp.AAC.1